MFSLTSERDACCSIQARHACSPAARRTRDRAERTWTRTRTLRTRSPAVTLSILSTCPAPVRGSWIDRGPSWVMTADCSQSAGRGEDSALHAGNLLYASILPGVPRSDQFRGSGCTVRAVRNAEHSQDEERPRPHPVLRHRRRSRPC
jgi:hypothetical protein